MLDIDEELDVHLHVTHDSSIDQWIFVADCGNKACCITSAPNSPADSRSIGEYVADYLEEWVRELQKDQLRKSCEYLTARLAEVDQRISEVSE